MWGLSTAIWTIRNQIWGSAQAVRPFREVLHWGTLMLHCFHDWGWHGYYSEVFEVTKGDEQNHSEPVPED